jgi:hypothetical protein
MRQDVLGDGLKGFSPSLYHYNRPSQTDSNCLRQAPSRLLIPQPCNVAQSDQRRQEMSVYKKDQRDR